MNVSLRHSGFSHRAGQRCRLRSSRPSVAVARRRPEAGAGAVGERAPAFARVAVFAVLIAVLLTCVLARLLVAWPVGLHP